MVYELFFLINLFILYRLLLPCISLLHLQYWFKHTTKKILLEGINDNEMHLIKKELRNSFYSIHGTVQNQSSIPFLLRFKSIFLSKMFFSIIFNPINVKEIVHFPIHIYTLMQQKKAKHRNKKTKNVISAIENEEK